VGSGLIAACEAWARARGLSIVIIGALSKNTGAFAAYERTGYEAYAMFLRKYLQ
jgi:GNAT superfamily N-acetyltransferase